MHRPVVAPAREERAPARARRTVCDLVALPGPYSRNPPAGDAAIFPAPSSATRGDHQVPPRFVTTGSPRQETASSVRCQLRLTPVFGFLFAGYMPKGTCQGRTVSRVMFRRQILDYISRCRDGMRSYVIRHLPSVTSRIKPYKLLNSEDL